MLVGAGTVLTREQVDAAVADGAKFIVICCGGSWLIPSENNRRYYTYSYSQKTGSCMKTGSCFCEYV